MNPIKLIRKLGKALRGGATFRDMFLGVFLGFAVGMIPGVNLTVIFLILLLLLLNTTGALACLSFMLGKVLCLALAPVTFRIGYTMIHDLGLVGLVKSAAQTPVVALMDLHVYCLIGALPLIIVIGGLLAWFVARSVIKARSAISSAVQGSEKVQKAAANKFGRFLMRVAFGKQKGKLADMSDSKSPLIRKGRCIAALVVIAVLAVVQMVYLDSMVKGGLEASIGSVNGAEVNIGKVDLSLLGGRLVIEDLQVTDADRPTHNLLQADRIVADISISDLLRRRFVMDLVDCEAMRTDIERKAPGEVYRKPDEEKQKPKVDLGELLGKLDKRAEYFNEIEKFSKRLQKLKEYFKSEDKAGASEPDKEEIARRARALGYLRMSAKDYLVKSPTWVVREVRVSRIELRPDLPTFTVGGKNLSSHPSLHNEDAELSARPDDEALKAFLAKFVDTKKSGLLGKILGKKDQKPEEDQNDKPGPLDKLFGK